MITIFGTLSPSTVPTPGRRWFQTKRWNPETQALDPTGYAALPYQYHRGPQRLASVNDPPIAAHLSWNGGANDGYGADPSNTPVVMGRTS